MKGSQIIERWPKWAERRKIQPSDSIYMVGDRIKVLRRVVSKCV